MSLNRKIKLYQNRDFAGNFDTSFAFIRQNYLPILKGIIWFVPIMLLVAYFMPNENDMMEAMSDVDVYENPFSMYSGMFTIGFFVAYFFLFLSSFLTMVYVACYMHLYVLSADGKVNSSKVWSKVFDSVLPIFVSSILYSILVIIGTVLCIIPGIIAAVYLYFYMYASIVEDKGIVDCLSRSYELVKNNWWVTLGFAIVFAIMTTIIGAVFSFPALLAMMGQVLNIEFFTSEIYVYIAEFISYAGSFLVYPLTYIAMGVMYFSHRNKLDGIDMVDEINAIGNIGNDSPYNKNY